MKLGCSVCGCHFPKEFEETLKPPCNFWGEIGMSNLPVDTKLEIWQWAFSLNVDEIAIKTKTSIAYSFKGIPFSENEWAVQFPEYESLSEEDQQDFQKQFFVANNKQIKFVYVPKKKKKKLTN